MVKGSKKTVLRRLQAFGVSCRYVNLIWDRINLRKVIAHRVEPDEVEEAFSDPKASIRRTKGGDAGRRYLMVARTESGRYLRVIFERLPEGVRVVTAFDATGSDHRLYWRS